MSYVIYYTRFGLDVKIDTLFFRLGKIDCGLHFCPTGSQILGSINICNINAKLLAPVERCVKSSVAVRQINMRIVHVMY